MADTTAPSPRDGLYNAPELAWKEGSNMSKGRDAKKQGKKEPKMTAKERKAAKRSKKEATKTRGL